MRFFVHTPKRTRIAKYVFAVCLVAVVCVMIGLNVRLIPKAFSYVGNVLKPVIYGLVIAFVLGPAVDKTEDIIEKLRFRKEKKLASEKAAETKNKKNADKTGNVKKSKKEKTYKKAPAKRILAVAAVYVLLLLLLFLFVMAIIPEISESSEAIGAQFSDFDNNLKNKTAEIVSIIPGRESVYNYYGVMPEIRNEITDDVIANSFSSVPGTDVLARTGSVRVELGNLLENAILSLETFIENSLPKIFSSALAVLNWMKNLVIGLIISFYFLVSEKQLGAALGVFFSKWLPEKQFSRSVWLIGKARKIFRDYITVRVLDCLIVGSVTAVCLSLFRTPYTVLISVIMGATSFFPFIGPAVGILSGALVIMIADERYLIIYLIFSVVINVLDFRFVEGALEDALNSEKDRVNIPAVWILTAIVFMGGMFGIFGIVFGIPIFAFVYSIVKDVCEKKLVKNGLPVKTSEY